MAHTGRIITTAAALFAVTFLAFATSKVSFMQLFGLGTTIAIVADATLIRGSDPAANHPIRRCARS